MSLIANASWCVALAGIVLGVAAMTVFRRPLLAMRVTMDMFVAAGLLRLSIDLSWTAIAGIAAVIAVRRLLTWSLTSDFELARFRAHA